MLCTSLPRDTLTGIITVFNIGDTVVHATTYDKRNLILLITDIAPHGSGIVGYMTYSGVILFSIDLTYIGKKFCYSKRYIDSDFSLYV